jgi:DNA-directed RNA polymerase subunit RPC12/RpoP
MQDLKPVPCPACGKRAMTILRTIQAPIPLRDMRVYRCHKCGHTEAMEAPNE